MTSFLGFSIRHLQKIVRRHFSVPPISAEESSKCIEAMRALRKVSAGMQAMDKRVREARIDVCLSLSV